MTDNSRISSAALRSLLKVYFIMGSVNCRLDPSEVLTEALTGGITLFQFREKGNGALTGRGKLELARSLMQLCRAHGVPFIVNDDLELAIALDADGIHVGQDDAPAGMIRRRLGAGKIIGVSAHNLQEAQQAIQDGADYLGVGPVYPTNSKADAQPVRGTQLIEELRMRGIDIPLVGIGGITLSNAAPVIAAGADGISLISAIAQADQISDTARGFVKKVDEELRLRG
ncbi:thiamine phosphate synthase [Paenibacillus sp. YPG26]|uniref:thiamine phosphate synthase n=1 Tax=Paenibacillus sp. YPG26 TaxID=2878915 RepID=UPI00203ED331|nr:thiamine phosphate synthase [Paenibacillus sp. YPG26]USB33083.1 thiamine phosphate synthase [Paenibacillus sp. YPG26]